MKKFLAIVLAVMMVMVTGCSKKPDGAVAKIGKEYIYQKDVDKVMEDYKQYYGQDIFNPNTEQGKEALKQIQPKIIDMLINEKIANKLMKDKKIELYDQKGKLLIKSDLYEAEVKDSSTNEYKKQENIIKYKGKYYKIYEPKTFD